tara:strand:- start:620 stop:862 length:243 start_codon:yes stop_codon:yes gene_type:complete
VGLSRNKKEREGAMNITCKYCDAKIRNAEPIIRMHLAQHITQELDNPASCVDIKEVAQELEKSLTIEVLVKIGLIGEKHE